jgi:hypothetical protein
MHYEQIEKLLLHAAVDDRFAVELMRAGSSAGVRYLLDEAELELLERLLAHGGAPLEAILRAVRAASDAAALQIVESMASGR